MAVTDPIYKINGIEASKSKIAEVAKGHNMTADEYITNFKGVLVPGKTTDSTVNANPNVESGNTELDAENGSLGSEDAKKRESLIFNITETESQINNYIEKGGEVNASDAAVLQKYKDELTAFDNIQSDNKFIEGIKPEILEIYKKNQKSLKKTEIGTIDYDDEQSIADFRNNSIDDFVDTNETINNKIIPLAKKEIESDFSLYENQAKAKYNLLDPNNITQENIDLYTKDVSSHYNTLLNSKIKVNPEFKSLIKGFNTVMDETAGASLKRFTKGKDWETGLAIADFAEESPYLSENLVYMLTKGYTGLRGIWNAVNKSGQYGGIQLTTDKIKSLNVNKDRADKQGWTDETKGYWIKDKTNEKGSYIFRPKFVGALKSNEGVSYRDNSDLIEQFRPAGSVEGSWGQFQNEIKPWIESRDEKNRKNLLAVQEEEFMLNAYDDDSFKNITEGKNVIKNTLGLLGEQLPQMGLAMVTLGASGGLQIGSSIYAEGIDNKAREIFNLPEGTEVSIAQKREVMMDDKFMDNLAAKATGGGFIAGQLDRLGAGRVFKGFIQGGAKSILRGGMNNFLKRAGARTVNNTITASTEAITEVLQEVIESGAAGSDIKSEQLVEAGGTGFLISLVTGVGGSVKSQTVSEVKTINRIVAGKLNPKSAEAFFNGKIEEIDKDIASERVPSIKEELQEKRQAILDARNANLTIPSNFSTVSKEKIFDLVVEKQNIEKEIKNKDPELVKEQTERIQEINTNLNKVSAVESMTQKAIKAGKNVVGGIVQTDIAGANKILAEEGQPLLDKNADGFFKEDGSIVLVMDRISDKGVFNTAAHEILHKVLYKTLVQESIVFKDGKKGRDVVKGLRTALESELNQLDPSIIKDKKLQARLALYKEEPSSVQAEEVLTLFADALAYGEISYSDSLGTKLKDVIRRVLQNLGIVDVEFNTGKDVYNFLKDYNQGIKKGKLGKAFTKAAKEGIKVGENIERSKDDFVFSDSKQSKTVLNEINDLVPSNVKTQADYFSPKVFNPIYKATQPNGVISNYIKSKSPSKEVGEKAIAGIQDRLVNYDPAAERKKAGNKEPITFGEFIFANTNFIKLDAKKALFKESEAAKKTTDLDTKEAQGKIAEDDVVKKDRPKFRKLIDSGVLPGFTIKEIGGKLTKVLKVLKSKLDAKVSINKSVSPLIAEIKKAMGKQADIDLKEAMGGKADAKLQKWLLKNKKAVLENMTTTWLMGAIPQAIQKSVGGAYKVDDAGTRVKDSYGDFIFTPNFTSDWQGKTIDREKTSTNKLGKTAGGDIVRRLPNIATALSDADFVGSVLQDVSIDADGKMTSGAPIRGKKESMAKAVAEEISLEVFNKELQNENSEISKAFENNQVARGVVLVDNFVEDITRQSERGTVKFSKTAIKLEVASDIIDGINTEEFKNRFFTYADDPKNKLPLYTSLMDHFRYFPIEGLKIGDLRKIAAELSKDYTFKPFGERGIERIQETEGVLKTLKYIQENTKEGLTRGNSYATAQQIYQSVDTKLDEKTIQGLNEGRAAVKKVVEVLVAQGFTGNEIKNIFVAVYSPSGLGGFKGKLNKDGKTRATPDSDILVESDLGLPNYKKDTETGMPTTQIENRGSFMVSVADFEQNFLKDIEMGDKVSTRTDAYTKNFWSKDDSVYNRLDNKGKKEYLQELQEGKIEFQASLIKFIEAVNKADISPAAQRTLIRLPFAAMDGLGKITSAPRWMPAKLDGTLLSLKDLVKLGFGRKDGKVDKGVFEHTKPANRMAIAAYIYSMTGKKADLDILIEELSDFDTAFITEGMDKGLVRNKLQSLMGLNYVRGAGVMTTRYAEMIQEMNKAGVTFYDAKTNTLLSPAGALGPQLNQEMKASLTPVKTEQKAINNARSIKWSQSPKKIRVFDFDDTLAQTKSNVLYTMPDGTTGKIDAATFAKDAGKMEAEGAQWDFSEFSKVMDGKAGPLLEVAKIIADKRGTKDVFVLTARPADAAGPIQEFLASMGLNIPLENITGLGNGTPKAKADWVVGKVADGYNDFYFADDHTGNVKAVKDALDTFDVKGKVQVAKVKFSKGLDAGFNSMIQRQKGVESFKEFSKATAKRRGKKTGKWKFFISPSAEDFRGLTQYKFAGKGKQGEADQKFFEESLMDPYFQGVAALESARQTIKEDTKALLGMFKPVKKKLNKLIPNEQYTYDAAVRVYLWNKAGNEIPGLSKRDNKKLNDIVANDPELSSFADGLLIVSKKDSWPEPGEHWLAQTTLSDLNNLTEKTNRKEYLTEFIENVDIIFSEKNLNKVEALYGEASRDAIENAISAMKSGSNSANQGGDAITSKWTQWVNNSIGTIMFFNRRSAILQTLSSANFINWSDNNPAKAALSICKSTSVLERFCNDL